MLPTPRRRILPGALLALALLVRPTFAACPPGSALFGPGVLVPAGADPFGMATGDFNHDGRPDLAVVISQGGTHALPGQIRVLLGNGDGTFAQGQLANAGLYPVGVTIGDFNLDGISDLAVSDFDANVVNILLGNGAGGIGDGTFGPPTAFTTGSHPHQLCTGDFNGDGILDIAVANNGGTAKSVSVLLGKGAGGVGNGQFLPNVDYGLAGQPVGVIAVDLDHDGFLDLVATEDFAGTVGFLKGKGDGTFFPAAHIPAGVQPYALDAADLNGDGIPDLIVTNSSSAGIDVLLNGGAGGILSTANYSVGNVANAHVADVNGDGIPDIVYDTSLNPVLGVLIGTGGGVFAPGPTVPTAGFNLYMALADFNQDGKTDAAVTIYSNGSVSTFAGICSAASADANKPRITSVRDVPNDQGGRVFVTWTKSALDVPGGAVNAYRVWRRIPSAQAQARLARAPGSLRLVRERAADGSTSVVYWEAAAVLPAQRLAGYGYTSATPQDSLPGSNPYTAFFITAATANIDVFYDSPVDSGYSVDNLAPAPPRAFSAQYSANAVALHWPANSEADLAGYQLYRGSSPGFIPGPGNEILAANDTAYTDPSGGSSTYKLAAVDVHGNRSAFVLVSPDSPTAAEVSLVAASWSGSAAELDWYVDAASVSQADVQREEAGGWTTLATVTPDGAGHVRWNDATLRSGQSADYRLQWSSPDGVHTGGQVSVVAPTLVFALRGAQPNPSNGRDGGLAFTLARSGDASLNIYDMAGRRVAERHLAGSPGAQRVSFASLRLPAGIYLARLTQGADRASARFVVVP